MTMIHTADCIGTRAWRSIFALVVMIWASIFGACSRSPDQAIEAVLNRCAQNSQTVNRSEMSAAQAAEFLADEMQKIDTRGCPQDFRVAFQQHINAWRGASPAFSQNTGLNAFMEGFASGVLQDSSLYGVSQRNAAIAVQGIADTYNRLTEIAAAYGARIPRSIVEK